MLGGGCRTTSWLPKFHQLFFIFRSICNMQENCSFSSISVPNIFSIYSQHFLIPEISEILRGSPTKIFGTVIQKIFEGKY